MGNNLVLNRLFTQASFQQIIQDHDDSFFVSVLHKYNILADSNEDAIKQIYKYLSTSYRNEYFYKNTILNKLLLGVHSLNTTTALTEVPVANSKADFVLINGKAVVYEIKTEHDNLDRLDSQIESYYKAFDRVCILTCDSYADTILEKYRDSDIGVYLLSEKNTIRRMKEPTKNDENIDLSCVFKILNKSEYEKIIFDYYKQLPNVTPVKYYKACKSMFINIPFDIAYSSFLVQLKLRNYIPNKDEFYLVPYELRSLVYFSKYDKKQYNILNKFLCSKIGGYK